MDNLFLFQFRLHHLFAKNEDAPYYARPIHVKGALALGQFQLAQLFHIQTGKNWLSVSRSIKMQQVSNYKDVEEREFSHRLKKIAQVAIVSAQEHLFREEVAHGASSLLMNKYGIIHAIIHIDL